MIFSNNGRISKLINAVIVGIIATLILVDNFIAHLPGSAIRSYFIVPSFAIISFSAITSFCYLCLNQPWLLNKNKYLYVVVIALTLCFIGFLLWKF